MAVLVLCRPVTQHQAKHFELGLVPPHYETLAMATFQYDAAKSRAEGDKNAAERRERKDGTQSRHADGSSIPHSV